MYLHTTSGSTNLADISRMHLGQVRPKELEPQQNKKWLLKRRPTRVPLSYVRARGLKPSTSHTLCSAAPYLVPATRALCSAAPCLPHVPSTLTM